MANSMVFKEPPDSIHSIPTQTAAIHLSMAADYRLPLEMEGKADFMFDVAFPKDFA
jgi:hypothetical protein